MKDGAVFGLISTTCLISFRSLCHVENESTSEEIICLLLF